MPKFIELQAEEKISTTELFGYAMKIFTDCITENALRSE